MKTILVILSLISSLTTYSKSQNNGCQKGYIKFEGKCVRLPKNATPSEEAPGWKCKSGYTVGHYKCKKVSIPKHATLSEDGIAWTCNKNYVPYRGKCVKNKK
jgi:hypothetical protein